MLCPTGDCLNGSHVSHWPVFRSIRCTPAKPLFCAQILPSTPMFIGLVMLICVFGRFHSWGATHVSSLPVFTSYLPIAAWYIMPSQMLPSRSKRAESEPLGEPFFNSGSAISVTFPVFG